VFAGYPDLKIIFKNMNVSETPIQGLLIIEPRIFEDPRGYFYESYNAGVLEKQGITSRFVQDNQSKSSYGVIRGLHYQLQPKAQSKLVRVLEGIIFDVAVDVRKGSPTYGKWFGIELSAANKKQLLIPKGFAHGFSVLSDIAVVFYKCDELYAPESDAGIIYNDADLNIDWKLPPERILISDKDSKLSGFKNAKNNFEL
jgi:dTDP-4-dehydrorhamnose 3,5-epimerase